VTSSTASRGRRGTLAAAAVVAALAVGGTSALAAGLAGGAGGPPQPPAAAPAAPAPPPPAASTAVDDAAGDATTDTEIATELDTKTLPFSRPVRLEIPSIGVDSSSLVDLGKQADGSLEVPVDYGQPGWFTGGPAPGQFGPAVIAGHVDSRSGPGIFYRLGELRAGETVSVTREDGTVAEFLVDRVERYPKDAFPTVEVYGDTTQRSELRLITCGGEFDTGTGHYVDNVVAYAHLI
jgi:sortase (surface protein transpeptidase)